MTDSNHDQTDRIAQHAAELLFHGDTDSTLQAIRTAASRTPHSTETKLPSVKLVRNHLRALAQQTLGATGYEQHVRDILTRAEEIMTLLEDADPQLVGRAANGRFDGDAKLHLRLYTAQHIGAIAELLVSFGYEEPKCGTAATKFGRFDRITFIEADLPVIITCCRPEDQSRLGNVDLFTRQPIPCLNLRDLRRQLDPDTHPPT